MTQVADALQLVFGHPVAAGVEVGKTLVNPTVEWLCDAAVSAAVPGSAPKALKPGRRGKCSGDNAADEAGGAFVRKRRRAPRFDFLYGTRKELKQFLDDMEPGEGATLVYDKRTGRFVLARSGEGATPEGWVTRNGGHSALAKDHFGVPDYGLDVMRGLPADHAGRYLVGGSISKLPNSSFQVNWFSGGINGGTASVASQSAGLSAIGSFANPLTPSGLADVIQGAAATPSGLSPPRPFYPNVK